MRFQVVAGEVSQPARLKPLTALAPRNELVADLMDSPGMSLFTVWTHKEYSLGIVSRPRRVSIPSGSALYQIARHTPNSTRRPTAQTDIRNGYQDFCNPKIRWLSFQSDFYFLSYKYPPLLQQSPDPVMLKPFEVYSMRGNLIVIDVHRARCCAIV